MNINLVYSGGTQNSSQTNSLGGFPSPVSIVENKNNLFDDISPQETTQGVTDYRCIYVFNDDTNASYSVNIFIEYLDEIGATVKLGLLQQNNIQSLQFTQIPTGGTFTLTVQGLTSGTITWDNDPNVLAANIQTAVQTITDCSVSLVNTGYYFKITFMGVLGNKSLTDMSVTNNNLLPYGTIFPTCAQVQVGSPINTVSPDTGFENLTPNGVPFNNLLYPGATIGVLAPSEGFPLWFQRSIAAGFEPVEGDGFILHVNAKNYP